MTGSDFRFGSLLMQRHQLDAVHARHVDVGDDQIEVPGAHRVPAVHAVHRDLDLVAVLPSSLRSSSRTVSESSTTSTRLRFFSSPAAATARHRAQAPAGHELVHRPDQVLGVDDQHRRAVLHQRAGGDVLDLAELRVERLHDQLALAEKPVDDQAVRVAARRRRRSPTARRRRARGFDRRTPGAR